MWCGGYAYTSSKFFVAVGGVSIILEMGVVITDWIVSV